MLKNCQSVEGVTPDDVVEMLRQLRVKNIVCLKLPINEATHPYLVICSPHNNRHSEAVVMHMRKFLKTNYYYPVNCL